MSLIQQMCDAAENSAIRRYSWLDRGRAKIGYYKGMAIAYGNCVQKLAGGGAPEQAMAVAVGSPERDALAHYAPEIGGLAESTATPADRLRCVFALLLGLGMRESSGKYCEGRDQSANNVDALTAEAGLFQTSFNSMSASPILADLFQHYQGTTDLRDVFSESVTCSPSSAINYGAGTGRTFQELTKNCPAFAVEYAAVLLRIQRRHWGPINKKRAELRADSFGLLRQIEALVNSAGMVPLMAQIPPMPNPPSDIVQRLVSSAYAEWEFFGRSTRSLANEWNVAGDEEDEPYSSRVGRYWRAVGESGLNGNTPQPWSAAFISWLFQNAGVGSNVFNPNAGHFDYVDFIRRNPSGLRLEPPNRVVEVGDLIWNSREPSVASHAQALAALQSASFFPSHADLVVRTGDGWCEAIGGNVSNRDPGGSVTQSTWRLDANGAIADKRKTWVGVVANGL